MMYIQQYVMYIYEDSYPTENKKHLRDSQSHTPEIKKYVNIYITRIKV